MKNTDKINILFIIDVLWGGGGTEHHLYYLTKYLNREKFRCYIVTFDLKEMLVKKIRREGIKVFHVPVARYYTPNALYKAYELRKIIKRNMIDIVQTFHFKSDTYGVLVSRLSGVKKIISSRRDTGDTKKKWHTFLNKIMNTQINRFITVCDAVGERLSADEGIAKSRQVTIYNGVDLERFTVQNKDVISRLRSKFNISRDDFVVGTVAHFRPEKNYDIFLRAMREVKETINNLKVLAVGRGPTLNECKAYCAKNRMNDYVLFPGRVDDVRDYIDIMDVACLVPGSNEGFSNAILEKMAKGKPLVVTDTGGNAEAVKDGENGIVIPPFNHKRLAEAIIYLYDNPLLRGEMGRKSREMAEKFFSIEKMITKHEILYHEIIES